MNNRSFTLIELLVVIAIIGLISSIVLVSMRDSRKRARITASMQFSHSVNHGLGAFAVGIWDFNENAYGTCLGGEDACDRSGYGNHGTINGATYVGGTDGENDATPYHVLGQGENQYALSFNSTNHYVNMSPFSPLSDIHTIEFWLNLPSVAAGSWRLILAVRGGGTDRAPGIWAHTVYPQRIHWRYNPGNIGFSAIGPRGEGTDFAIDTWYHIVGAKNKGTLDFYVNGSLVASTAVSNPMTVPTSSYLRIGNSLSPRNMLIDEVRIYEQALTLGQIQQRYAESAPRHGIVLNTTLMRND